MHFLEPNTSNIRRQLIENMSVRLIHLTTSDCLRCRTRPAPISWTSGHWRITKMMKQIDRNVVNTRTLLKNRPKIDRLHQWLVNIKSRVCLTHLVLRKGIIMPAAVATKSRTTCNIVNTTLMSFTTRARAFELSMPSTVTYCCCDICSIFDICVGGKRCGCF